MCSVYVAWTWNMSPRSRSPFLYWLLLYIVYVHVFLEHREGDEEREGGGGQEGKERVLKEQRQSML